MKNIVHGLALALMLGCGDGIEDAPSLVPATGTVTYNGKPLANATVTLLSTTGGRIAVGQSDAGGAFILTTDGKDGAVPGSHKVSVVAIEGGTGPQSAPEEGSEAYEKMMSGEGSQAKSLIPEKYNSAESSGLTATISAGAGQITLELKD